MKTSNGGSLKALSSSAQPAADSAELGCVGSDRFTLCTKREFPVVGQQLSRCSQGMVGMTVSTHTSRYMLSCHWIELWEGWTLGWSTLRSCVARLGSVGHSRTSAPLCESKRITELFSTTEKAETVSLNAVDPLHGRKRLLIGDTPRHDFGNRLKESLILTPN